MKRSFLALLIAILIFAFALSSCDENDINGIISGIGGGGWNGNIGGNENPGGNGGGMGGPGGDGGHGGHGDGIFDGTWNVELPEDLIAGHTPVIDAYVAPTCTQTGLTPGAHCADCGEVLVAQQEIPMTEHVYDNDRDRDCNVCGYVRDMKCKHTNVEILEGKPASCTEFGLTSGEKCRDCGEILTAQTVIVMTNHTEETIPGKAPTCTETGLTDGVKCSVCGKIITEQTVIPMTDHVEETIPGKAATCTETGLTDGVKCSVCGKIITEQVEIPLVPHTYDDKYDDTCNVCGFVRDAECAHANTVTIPGKAATCTETGLTDGSKCSKCGEILTEQTVIPKKDHTESDWIIDTAAKCTVDGSKHKECTVCGTTIKTETITKLGHTEVQIPGKDATCTSTGLTDGVKCSTCNTILTAQTVISKKDHTESDWIIDTAAKCTVDGSKHKECTVCHATLKTETITKTGHTEVKIPGKAATCTETGLTDGVKCSVCGTIFTAQTVIPKKDHTESDWIIDKAATVDEEGSRHTECTVCHTVIKTEIMGKPELLYALNSDGKSYSVIGINVYSDNIDLKIPSTYKGKPVTAIGEKAFSDCIALMSVIIPDSVTSIGDWAFYKCTSLASVTIGNGVISIGNCAFDGCAFNSIIIPDSVTSIGAYAFHQTSLTSINIPESVTSISNEVFRYCHSLTNITVDENNQYYKSIDGNLYTKDGKTLIQYTIGKKDTLFVIPDGVITIERWACNGCGSLTNVIIPDSVRNIGYGAFAACVSLTSVNIPHSVNNISHEAFCCCSSLASITVDEDNEYYKSMDGNLYTKDGTTLIQYAIGKKDASLVIPDSVKNIESLAFQKCEWLKSVVIPDSVISIRSQAFDQCDVLTKIHYNGTKTQWEAIEKRYGWDMDTPSYTVYCTDGNISK